MNLYINKLKFSLFPMFVLMLSAGSIFYVFFRKELLYFTFFLFAGLFFFKCFYKKEIMHFLQLSIIFISFLIINFLFAIHDQSVQKILANIVIFSSSIFASIFYQREENKEKFIEHLRILLKIVLIHSLFNFTFYPFVKPFLFEISNDRYDCLSFLYLFYYLGDTHIFNVFNLEFARNQGFFWEPGVLQILLNLLLFIEGFIYKKKGTVLWLTVGAILSTFSTTGLLVMSIQLFLLYLPALKKNLLWIPLLMVVFSGVFYVTASNVQQKLTGDGKISFQARFFDLIQPLYIVSDHPITGVGLDDEQFLDTRQSVDYSLNLEIIDFSNRNKGSTNSIMFFLAAAGIPFTLLILVMLFHQQFIIHKRWWFFVFLLISLMSEPLLLRPFFLIFIMSGAGYLINKFKWKIY